MRLFIAVNLPSDIRERLWEAAASLRSARFPIRWVSPDALHLTLKFLGEVAAQREEAIVTGLARAVEGARPFTLPISGFGAFPSADRPRVVWAGCAGVPPLELLQHRVEREMERAGFALEGRPFRPHLTLGRVQRGAKASALRAFPAALAPLAYEAEILVRSVDLMQSTLHPAGARYTVRHAAGLAA